MSKRINLSAQFAKVITKEDGGREVWGFATLERKDKSGEIADFEGTVKAFEAWSNETEQRTGGKSLGNVRVMHQPIAAGKTIHWEPSETEITKADGEVETVKAIWVGAYIPPTKEDVIKDIDEGILNAFSIGGSYEKRWWDEGTQAFRYIPKLSEYSLVDNPCVEGADIVNVINKANGPWNKEKGGIDGMDTNQVEDLNKRAPTGSYEDLERKVSTACSEKFRGMNSYWDGYVIATYPDKVIVYAYENGKYYEIPYSEKNGNIELGAEVEVQQAYIPVEAQKFVESELAKRAEEKAKEETTSDTQEVEKTEGDELSVKKEEMTAAAKSAGISTEQLQAFLKAFEGTAVETEKPADIEVPVVDGDADTDDNKEFPNPPEGTEVIDIPAGIADVKEAEKSVGDELQKSGKAISKANMIHLQHAIGHVDAVMKGMDYGPDHHLTVENGTIDDGPNSGEESPNVVGKSYLGEFNSKLEKAFETELNKTVNKLESLIKGLPTTDTLTKMVDRLSVIEKLVEEIHNTPQTSGVMMNGGSPDVLKMLRNSPTEDNADVVNKFISNIKDPALKSRVGEEIALQQAKQILR